MKAAVLELPRPRLEHFRVSIGALLLIGWTFFAYDLSVLDLQSTKRAALITGASVWGLFALIRGLREPEKRIAFGVPLLILVWAVLPAVARGAPIVQTLGKPIYLAFLALSWALVHRTVTHREGVAGLLWGLTGLALVIAGSAIVEVLWLGGDPDFSGAPVVTFGNPNHLGAALVLLMPPVLACLESRTFRIGVLVVAVLTMFAIGLSGSYLALMGGAAVLGIAAAGPTHPVRRRILIVGLLMFSLAGGFVSQSVRAAPGPEPTTAAAEDTTPVSPSPVSPSPVSPSPVSPSQERSAEKESPTPADTTDSSAGSGFGRALKGRLYLVERGAEVVASAPLTGIGVGEYAWGFALVQADHLEAHPEDAWLHTRLVHAHNDPLELLAEYGLFGLLGLGLGLGILRALALRRPMGEGDTPAIFNDTIPSFAISGLALTTILSLGHFVLYAPQVAILGVVFLACLSGRRVDLEVWQSRALGVALALLVVVGLGITIRAYSAERLLTEGIEAMENGDYEEAERILSDAQGRHPDPGIAFYRGTALLLAGEPQKAAESLDYAAWLLPYSEVHLNHGLALCQAGYDDAALEALETAVRLDPGNARARSARAACERAIAAEQ